MDLSFLINNGGHYVDSLYQDFLEDPHSVDQSWQNFFKGYGLAKQEIANPSSPASENVDKELKVQKLIEGHRRRGHLKSKINPIRPRKDLAPGLELSDFGLDEQDLDRPFHSCQSLGKKNLKETIQYLKTIYCGSLGFEYCHITDHKERDWLQKEIESTALSINFSPEKQKRILKKLSQATLFENFFR